MVSSKLLKTASLLGTLGKYVVPRGDAKIRLRIGAAFACLVAAKGSNMITPLPSAQMWARQSSGFSGEDDDTLIGNLVERVN